MPTGTGTIHSSKGHRVYQYRGLDNQSGPGPTGGSLPRDDAGPEVSLPSVLEVGTIIGFQSAARF